MTNPTVLCGEVSRSLIQFQAIQLLAVDRILTAPPRSARIRKCVPNIQSLWTALDIRSGAVARPGTQRTQTQNIQSLWTALDIRSGAVEHSALTHKTTTGAAS
jgi:hypothetical protein